MNTSIALLPAGLVIVAQAVAAAAEPGQPGSPAALDEGHFHAAITVAEETEEFTTPSKALAELRTAAGKLRRSGDAEAPFKAVLDVNGGKHAFSKPADAQAAVQGVLAAMSRARKAGIGFGELGKVDLSLAEEGELDPVKRAQLKEEQLKALGDQQKKLQAQQLVQYRIQLAISNELRRSRGIPNPIRMQQIAQEEINKARAEGLLPDASSLAGINTDPAALARQAELTSIRQQLAAAFRAGKAADQPDKPAQEAPAKE